MAVVMDRPRRLKDGRLAAHLLSDRPNRAGGVELVGVAVAIGCHPAAAQNVDTYKEHFDLVGERRVKAALAHPGVAQVTWRDLAGILRAKRNGEVR